ncbi:MAG: diguanylate cyclase [Gammaproteobacteria bacterium]|nr:diguanylate cyclase [Gammaproteobacteria bacterium]
MSESSDWKQKYRDSLREMESEEKRWRQIEQALRRLVGRLCAAGMGVDPQLDDELVALAAANRRNADAAELEKLAASLTTAVVAVDAVSPVPTIITAAVVVTPWDSTCVAAGKILQCLRSLIIDDAAAMDLIARLAQAKSDADLAAILEKSAELLHSHGETLARERLQAAAVLGDVTIRLEEMAGYLTESGDEARSRFADTASVNDTVMSQVRELRVEADAATELHVLQTIVSARLATVTKQVLDFRSREESRLLQHADRAERMRARISDLEREAQELHSKLDREKHGARLDPLTRLANRKSFDERFAQEVVRRSQSDLPVTMLLWDLDNFKVINDSYGHRAGDRVLQSVATCFMSGLRAEDFVARIGGEEFVILLTGLPFARALCIADELRMGVEALRFHFRGTPVRITVSCGLTELRLGDAAGDAFDRADTALYRAKHGGKNACVAA